MLPSILALVLSLSPAQISEKGLASADYLFVSHLGSEFEVPPVVTVDAHGSAALTYDVTTGVLAWRIEFTGMSADPTGAHIHGPADESNNAGVMIDLLANSGGNSSPITGSTVISAGHADTIFMDLAYINLHTPSNGGGEVRGQIYLVEEAGRLEAAMDPGQETTPVTGAGSAQGAAVFDYDPVTDMLSWQVRFSDLTGPLTGMHIHGPAEPGASAGVVLDLTPYSSGSTSPLRGSFSGPSPTLVGYIAAERAYVNLHTSTNGAGEIRGQVTVIVMRDGFE